MSNKLTPYGVDFTTESNRSAAPPTPLYNSTLIIFPSLSASLLWGILFNKQARSATKAFFVDYSYLICNSIAENNNREITKHIRRWHSSRAYRTDKAFEQLAGFAVHRASDSSWIRFVPDTINLRRYMPNCTLVATHFSPRLFVIRKNCDSISVQRKSLVALQQHTPIRDGGRTTGDNDDAWWGWYF